MIRAAALSLSVFALMACSPKSGIVKSEESPSTAPAPVATEAAMTVANEDAAAGLGKLGLTVFPEPQPIPAIELVSLEGKSVTLASYEGKYVFLNFWATWCPPCREEMPSIQRMNDALAGSDFGVFAVSVGEAPATVASFLKKSPYTFPIALDQKGEISSIFAGRGIPTTYILDRQGRAIAGIIGSRQWDTEEVLAAFKTLLARE